MKGPELQARGAGGQKKLPPVESRFKPGVSGNPGGKPKGFVTAKQAIDRCLALSVSDLELVRDGTPPKGWPEAKVTSAYSLAAGLILSGRSTGSNATIVYDRSEGPVQVKLAIETERMAEELATPVGVSPVRVLEILEILKGER